MLIAILFFRRVSFMIIAAAPPLIAILLALGALGWLDFRLNMFLNVMTPLIMVISFSDSMQLTFAARAAILSGEDKRTAFRQAILVVGPACVLTPRDGGAVVRGAAVFRIRPDPHFRRGGAGRDADRACRGAHLGAAARLALGPPGNRPCRDAGKRRPRGVLAAGVLHLDRRQDGEASVALYAHQHCRRFRARRHLWAASGALPPCRSTARPREGCAGGQIDRRQTAWRQSDRRADPVSRRRLALCVTNACRDR